MDKPRKPKFRNGDKLSQRLLSTSYDTEENRLQTIKMNNRSNAHEKFKEEVKVVEQTEVLDNNDFQKEVLLNQILNEVKEVRSLVGQILEGQVNMEKSLSNRLTIFEERINRDRT